MYVFTTLEWKYPLTSFIQDTATAKSLQSCPTLCDPIDGSPPSLPSLGFSRQEYWSGLPFPSPMHESEKWKRSRSVVFDPQRLHGLQPSRFLRPWDFPGKSTHTSPQRFIDSTTLIISHNHPLSGLLGSFHSSFVYPTTSAAKIP